MRVLTTGQIKKLLAVKDSPPQTAVRLCLLRLSVVTTMSKRIARCMSALNMLSQVKLHPENVNKLIQTALAVFKEEVVLLHS